MDDLLAGLVPGLPEPRRRAILDRAEGIPLYAVETVRMLLADGRLERVDGESTARRRPRPSSTSPRRCTRSSPRVSTR